MLTPIAVANPGALGDSPALSDAYQSLPKVNDFSFLTPLGLSPELAWENTCRKHACIGASWPYINIEFKQWPQECNTGRPPKYVGTWHLIQI